MVIPISKMDKDILYSKDQRRMYDDILKIALYFNNYIITSQFCFYCIKRKKR